MRCNIRAPCPGAPLEGSVTIDLDCELHSGDNCHELTGTLGFDIAYPEEVSRHTSAIVLEQFYVSLHH